MADNWYSGNANGDADDYRGWLLGHFISVEDGVGRLGRVRGRLLRAGGRRGAVTWRSAGRG